MGMPQSGSLCPVAETQVKVSREATAAAAGSRELQLRLSALHTRKRQCQVVACIETSIPPSHLAARCQA